jgi:transcriptional regulator with XRE-family HTH domain
MLVGARLRRLRTDKGISREQAGQAIRASAWKIHRLENGQVGFKDRDVTDLLALYGVTDPQEVQAFAAIAREANTPSWWSPFGDLLPSWVRAYIDMESAASLIRTYEGQFVPGLLQTEDYQRAVTVAAHLGETSEDVERRVALRLARQGLLERTDGFRLWAVVDEAALRRPFGGPRVMRAQLGRLIEAAALPTVTLQVLPLRASAAAVMVGGFSILRFPEPDLPDVVYVEQLTGALYLDRPDDIARYVEVMNRLGVGSETPAATPKLLNQILHET